MEVKAGYRQTQVGAIPQDWELRKLEEVAVYRRGSFPQPYGLPKWYDEHNGMPFVQVFDVDVNMKLKAHTKQKISDAAKVKSVFVEKGSIVLAIQGSIGRIAITQYDAYVDRTLLIFKSFLVPMDKQYFMYIVYELFQREKEKAPGSTIRTITKEELSSFQIPLPRELIEQQRIARALSDVDALIASLNTLIAKKQDMKQAAMQQLLTGKRRMPGFSGVWEERTLDELGEISGAGVDKKIRSNEIPVRLVNYLDVYRKDFIYSNDLNHLVTAPLGQAARCSVKKGDIFFTPSSEVPNDIGVSAVAMEDISDAAYSYHVVRLRLAENWDLAYRAYGFKSRHFLDQAERLCEGSGVRYVITQARFRQLTVRVPPTVEEQASIGKVLFDMDAEIMALEQRRDKTIALKQGMMQELLTGRIRLVKPSN